MEKKCFQSILSLYSPYRSLLFVVDTVCVITDGVQRNWAAQQELEASLWIFRSSLSGWALNILKGQQRNQKKTRNRQMYRKGITLLCFTRYLLSIKSVFIVR